MLLPIDKTIALNPKGLELQIKIRESLVYKPKHGKVYTGLLQAEIKFLSERYKFLTGKEVFI